jgi:hypothetical protein
LTDQVFFCAIIQEYEIGHFDALSQVLFVRVGRIHFSFLIFQEGLPGNLVSFRLAKENPLITELRISVGRNGNITMPFNTKAMFRGTIRSGGKAVVKIYPDCFLFAQRYRFDVKLSRITIV